MITAIFEDEAYENFLPLTYTRPVFELRSGMYTLLERTQKTLSTHKLLLFTRNYLAPTLKKRVTQPVNQPESIDDETLLINATLLTNNKIRQLANKKLTKNTIITQNNRIALARLTEDVARNLAHELLKPQTTPALKKLTEKCKTLKTTNLPLLTYPWNS